MSRSGYSNDYDGAELHLYRGTVASATRGKRGQTMLKDMLAALDAMPVKRLVKSELETATGEVCAFGALGQARELDMREIDPEDSVTVAATFNVADCLAREVVYENDENGWGNRVEMICKHCHGWGEVAGYRGHPVYCRVCSGTGRRFKYLPETPEARWERMRAWVKAQIHT